MRLLQLAMLALTDLQTRIDAWHDSAMAWIRHATTCVRFVLVSVAD